MQTITDSFQIKKLKSDLVDKQRLYAQMQKDNITGPVKEKLAGEIREILVKVYPQAQAPRQ